MTRKSRYQSVKGRYVNGCWYRTVCAGAVWGNGFGGLVYKCAVSDVWQWGAFPGLPGAVWVCLMGGMRHVGCGGSGCFVIYAEIWQMP